MQIFTGTFSMIRSHVSLLMNSSIVDVDLSLKHDILLQRIALWTLVQDTKEDEDDDVNVKAPRKCNINVSYLHKTLFAYQ